ncbi:autotransporter outer membrane beta-barrel domain-containing protein [Fusobacterium varium]|uniref:autotransporter outer membrane beta-barrel domain-containing protein n=1 Tax=Fusobacterium varium TaxID=856 RepID=UPI001F20542F|nr:autotransporter outer membrane beta-barrel domain-containing protein [Fusobacterium varium]MCF2674109.1 autotransporter outer membrane beta-barrel domain-containing protein [Fusobacterium varium]
MIEKVMKAVKSSNKRRGRNITIGAVVGFLLSCTAVMGEDNYLWIKEDGVEIKFSIDGTTTSGGTWNEKNPYEDAGNIWKENTYTNNMTLSSSAANGVNSLSENMSYGLRLSGNLTGVNFINNGSITGIMSTTSGTSNGYGIYNTGTMGDITNRGVISGYGDYSGTSTGNGYGSGIYNLYTIGDITNTGIINGYGNGAGYGNGYGIFTSITNGMGNITNTGVISGSGSSKGYGIYNSVAVENVTNIGVISGSSNGIKNSYTMKNIINTGIISSNGSGIYNDSLATIGAITNTGVIYGKDNAIKNDDSGTITTAYNYGILANGDGGTIDVNTGLIFKVVGGTYKAEEKDYEKFGKIYKDKDIVIDYQKDGAGKSDLSNPITEEYTIINAKALGNDRDDITGTKSLELENGILTYGDFQTINISPEKRYILNGITNTLKISGENNELNNSVINAYKTAVVMENNDSTLILNNTVVNGGILGNDPTISITGNKNILTIQGNSVINGTMESTGKNNTLNFNGNGESGINILHNISGFSNMNIGENTNVTLFEKNIGADGKETALEVSGVKEIDIKAGGVLNLRIDSQKLNGGRYEGHALFGNKGLKINGDISQLSDGKTEIEETEDGKYKVGVFNLVTNGLGINSIIAMDGITLNENLFVKTNSILDKATIIKNPSGSEKEGDIKIEGKQDIFEMYVDKSKRYIKLNEIYKGIYSSEAENFNALKDILTLNAAGGDYTSVTDKEQLATLLSYLNNIYTRTPYSFSSELSRKSAGMFRDIVTENQFRPDMNKWLIMGGLTHRDGGTKDTYYGKNYHGFDTGTADVDTDMKLTGAYALGKYGYSENVSLGVTVGGNKSEAKLPMSKVKGNSGYVGAFAENYRGNLTLKAGAGIQYSEYDANRATLGGHSYSDKYSDMAYDIYLNGRYSHNIGENLFLEPYGTLSYTYVDQEGAYEGSKVLAIETDSKSFDYTAAKVGVDLKKVIPHEKGKSTLSAGVVYTRLLTGADEENITGRFKGGSDFDILVAHKNKHSIGLNAKYALELESGILFDVKGSYLFERDSHNESGKNRNKGEWIVGVGLGYKF